MPLYERKAKGKPAQRVRTVPRSATDDRMRHADDWQLVDESKPKSKTDDDVRTGTGTARVNVGQNGGA